jgi:hypothetical protein
MRVRVKALQQLSESERPEARSDSVQHPDDGTNFRPPRRATSKDPGVSHREEAAGIANPGAILAFKY